jgi:hypothetical protein
MGRRCEKPLENILVVMIGISIRALLSAGKGFCFPSDSDGETLRLVQPSLCCVCVVC